MGLHEYTTVVRWVSAQGNEWTTRTMGGPDCVNFCRDVEASGGKIISLYDEL